MANEDKAARYHRLRRRASLLATATGALFLLILLVTGGSAAVRDFAEAASGGRWFVAVLIYAIIVALVHELLQVPLAFYHGVTLERRYGLSVESAGGWWREHAKAAVIGILFAAVGAIIVIGLIRWSAERWWLAAGLAFAAILVVMAQLAPVLLLPLFYDFKPLDRPALTNRLLALAERAGVCPRGPKGQRALGVFEWRLSAKTRKANAALAGLGRTRRILLSDTLLAEHSDEEIEVILAHELAHHVHGDILREIALETVLIVLGFYAADAVLGRFAGWFGLAGKSDVAALPLLVLTAGTVSLLLLPIANAMSRAHERRADRYALQMTGNAPALISAMKRLGAQNLAEDAPAALVKALFYTHPPMAERIEAARRFTPPPGRAVR